MPFFKIHSIGTSPTSSNSQTVFRPQETEQEMQIIIATTTALPPQSNFISQSSPSVQRFQQNEELQPSRVQPFQQFQPQPIMVQQSQQFQQKPNQNFQKLQNEEMQSLKDFGQTVQAIQIQNPNEPIKNAQTAFASKIEAIEKQQLQNQVDKLQNLINSEFQIQNTPKIQPVQQLQQQNRPIQVQPQPSMNINTFQTQKFAQPQQQFSQPQRQFTQQLIQQPSQFTQQIKPITSNNQASFAIQKVPIQENTFQQVVKSQNEQNFQQPNRFATDQVKQTQNFVPNQFGNFQQTPNFQQVNQNEFTQQQRQQQVLLQQQNPQIINKQQNVLQRTPGISTLAHKKLFASRLPQPI